MACQVIFFYLIFSNLSMALVLWWLISKVYIIFFLLDCVILSDPKFTRFVDETSQFLQNSGVFKLFENRESVNFIVFLVDKNTRN